MLVTKSQGKNKNKFGEKVLWSCTDFPSVVLEYEKQTVARNLHTNIINISNDSTIIVYRV
jgi:hypothetical protein